MPPGPDGGEDRPPAPARSTVAMPIPLPHDIPNRWGARWGPTLRVAVAALLGALAVQVLVVLVVYSGEWTGPFLVDVDRSTLPAWPLEVAASPTGTGYDGMFYLMLAFDPALGDLGREADMPRYRGRRILVPALAWATGLAHPPAVVAAYYFWCALFVGLGAGALGDLAVAAGRSPWWGLLVLFQLGTVVSLWRMLIDPAAAALGLATIAAMARHRRGWTLVLLSAALLARETSLLLLVAVAGGYLLAGRWRETLRSLLALLPLAAWWGWLALTVPPDPVSPAALNFGLPFATWVDTVAGALIPWVSRLVALKEVASLGSFVGVIVFGLVLAASTLLRNDLPPAALAAALALGLYSVLGLALGSAVWVELWAYSRVLLIVPLLAAALAFVGPRGRLRLAALLPALASALAGALFLYFLVREASP